jgi:PleD family two-component response regulator
MNQPEPDSCDTASLRQAALLPCALMVVGAIPALANRRRELTLEGYNVTWVATLAKALARHELSPCSVILVAQSLPDGTNSELISLIRAQSHSSYVYLIAQVVDEGSVGQDADDWVAVSASYEDLTARLRAARRIVTMERSCRIGNDTARMALHFDQNLGTYGRQFFTSEAVRALEHLQRTDHSMALLLVRAETIGQRIEPLTCIAETLLDLANSDGDVVARLSPVTFGLLMCNIDEQGAADVQQRVTRQLSQVQSTLACGLAVVNGPIIDAHDSLHALMQTAEQTMRAIEPAAPEDFSNAMGV